MIKMRQTSSTILSYQKHTPMVNRPGEDHFACNDLLLLNLFEHPKTSDIMHHSIGKNSGTKGFFLYKADQQLAP